ncbi:ARD/ARD' family protein [Ancylostoma caninum]|uniref:ARD/ARD' family protein n=1 Tax=Ancylostoma caninum TaxID=29170 RepID=A0A368G1K6_ANCCA|nr:ARD/ARD' family protein [Ancylostoma caninum]
MKSVERSLITVNSWSTRVIYLVVHSFLNSERLQLEEYYEPTTKDQDVVSLIMDGSCYYDVEPEEDEWIRIHLERGDLIVIPKGVSHRFTVTPQNYVQMQRFFPKKPDDVQG